jgi:hypothetical protein
MNINDIITEAEYTKERSAKELFEWMSQKDKDLLVWCQKRPIIERRELEKELPEKFYHELMPFAYYANNYYGDKPEARFTPCCDTAKPYEGIVVDSGNEIFVEITGAIFGNERAVIKEVLNEKGIAPWEYDILGVNKKNRAEKKKEAIGIVAGGGERKQVDCICELKKLVKKAAEDKCKKSLELSLPYGQKKTILIVTFVEVGGSRPSKSKKDWDDFVNFKHSEIDFIKHNFSKIILFGWLDRTFID